MYTYKTKIADKPKKRQKISYINHTYIHPKRERPSFTSQKAAFQSTKGRLLSSKRRPFTQLEYNQLIFNELQTAFSQLRILITKPHRLRPDIPQVIIQTC